MDTDYSKYRRAGTKFKFYKAGREVKHLEDRCILIPDDLNDGYYIALSEQTGKVGWGDTLKGAYVDLLVGISTALKYTLDNNLKVGIGVLSSDAIWKDGKTLRKVRRMNSSDQSELIELVKSIITEKPAERKKHISGEKFDFLAENKLEKTVVGVVLEVLEDVA